MTPKKASPGPATTNETNGLWLKISSADVLGLMTSVQALEVKIDTCSGKIDRLFDGQSKLKASIEATQNCSENIEEESKSRDVANATEIEKVRTVAAADVEKAKAVAAADVEKAKAVASSDVEKAKTVASVEIEKVRGEVQQVKLMNDRVTRILAALTVIATALAAGLAVYWELAKRAVTP